MRSGTASETTRSDRRRFSTGRATAPESKRETAHYLPRAIYNLQAVPLSDREQEILNEIEKNLHDEDPRFARDVGSTRTSHTGNIRNGLIIFVVGLALLIGFFLSGWLIVGVIAFGTMVGGIVLAAGALTGLASSQRAQRDRMSQTFSQWERRIRERYRRR